MQRVVEMVARWIGKRAQCRAGIHTYQLLLLLVYALCAARYGVTLLLRLVENDRIYGGHRVGLFGLLGQLPSFFNRISTIRPTSTTRTPLDNCQSLLYRLYRTQSHSLSTWPTTNDVDM